MATFKGWAARKSRLIRRMKNKGSRRKWLTLIKVGQPGVILSFVLLAVVIAALYRPETRRPFWAWLSVANFVATPLAYAKLPTVRRFRMVALPLDDRDTCAAAPRALAPRTPFAPSAVDLTRPVHDRHALLVLTPLRHHCFINHALHPNFSYIIRYGLPCVCHSEFPVQPDEAWWCRYRQRCTTVSSRSAKRNTKLCNQFIRNFRSFITSCNGEQTEASLTPNCNLHWCSALYIAPGGKSGYA